MKSVRRLALLFSLAALAASSAMAHERRIRAGDLPTCSETTPDSVWLLDAASATTCDGTTGEYEAHCCCANGAWAACEGSSSGVADGDKGDITVASSGASWTIDADAVTESDLKAVDAAADEECLTYETTTGDFEWQACGSGGSLTLDLADDGSNESTALSELATDNDDYSVVTEPSADKALFDFAKVPPYQQYDPDRPPSSCATCDEFTGDAASLTWRWGNQGASTIAYGLDQAELEVPVGSGENLRVRWTTGADGSATDWVTTASIVADPKGNYNLAGLALIAAGDETTPTHIQTCARQHNGNNYVMAFVRFNNYTTFNSNTDATGSGEHLPTDWTGATYIQLRYVSSTKVLSCHWSLDGKRFFETFTTLTLGAHPTTSIGFFINAANPSVVTPLYVNWFRQRTDATGTSAPYPVGE